MKLICSSCLVLLIATLAGISCVKQNDQPGNSTGVCRLTKATRGRMEHVFSYDSIGRLQQLYITDTTSVGKSVFIYLPDSLKQIDSSRLTTGGSLTAAWIRRFKLNDKGLATAVYGMLANTRRDTTYHTYNSEGYLVHTISRKYAVEYGWSVPSQTEETWYTIAGGNRVKDSVRISVLQSQIVSTKVNTYTYYEGTTEYPTNFYTSSPLPLLGKGNVSLLKTASLSVNSQPTIPLSSTFTYTLDDDGKPIRIIEVNSSVQIQSDIEYTCR